MPRQTPIGSLPPQPYIFATNAGSTITFTVVTLSRSTGSAAPAFDTVESGRFTGEVLPVPEPGTAALVAASAAIAGLRRWRRRRVQPTHPYVLK
ncbi:MAG: PEP-CTERM sorting domain-containing protein [Planctomyces sp.]|nr:PEP-CTERM sorting domain-containing protein [Planctomyces sp.]